MAEETGQEKTEEATQKRREETRRRGNVARSTEVNSAVMLLTGFSVLLFFRQHIVEGLKRLISGMFIQSYTFNLGLSNASGLLLSVMYLFFTILLPVFVIMVAAGILVNIIQVGIIFTGEPLLPKSEKINPFEGAKRIMS